MLIIPRRPKITIGASQFWRAPPAPPLELAIVDQVSVAYSAWGSSSTINLPLTAGGGVKSGDMLIVQLGVDSDSFNQHSFNYYDSALGWTRRGQQTGQYGTGAVFTKVCDGTETSPTSMGMTGGAQSWSYNVYRVEGADPNAVPHGFGNNRYDSNSTWFGTPTVTPTVDGCLFLSSVVGGYGAQSFTVPGPWVEEFDQTNGGATGSWVSMSGASYIQPTAAGTRPIHTCSASIKRSYLSLICLKPWNA